MSFQIQLPKIRFDIEIENVIRCLVLVSRHDDKLGTPTKHCKGRFWEGRFKSQALLDTAALLACMTYVDLNPVHAGMADSVEGSDFTSIQARLFDMAHRHPHRKSGTTPKSPRPAPLLPFVETEHAARSPKALPFNLKDYIELVDYTGRCVRDDKRGAIPQHQPRLLSQLGLSAPQWRLLALEIQRQSLAALGAREQLEKYHASINKHWMSKQAYLRRCYPDTA